MFDAGGSSFQWFPRHRGSVPLGLSVPLTIIFVPAEVPLVFVPVRTPEKPFGLLNSRSDSETAVLDSEIAISGSEMSVSGNVRFGFQFARFGFRETCFRF